MMKVSFKQLAVDFVRENNCAMSTPVELIEKAMEAGACEMARVASARVRVAYEDLRDEHFQNVGGPLIPYKPNE